MFRCQVRTEFHPLVQAGADPLVEVETWNQMAHSEQKHGQTERGAGPKTPGHVFGIVTFCVGVRTGSL
jgi:hypothetical protein